MKFDQDLCATCDMNSTLGSVVPLAMFISGPLFSILEMHSEVEKVGKLFSDWAGGS